MRLHGLHANMCVYIYIYIYINRQSLEKVQLELQIMVQFCATCSKLFIFREGFIS